MSRRQITLGLVVAALLVLAYAVSTAPQPSTRSQPGQPDPAPASALPAPPGAPPPTPSAPPAAIPDYDREEFEHWSDLDGNGCDTRADVLARDALPGTVPDCEILDRVVIVGPYTGERVEGRSEIDVDHVVSLGDAWHSGAYAWTDAERERFANDMANLLATDDGTNQSKGDQGPDEWRPPAQSGWCEYATTYSAVKVAYRLVITPAQQAALDDMREGCSR